MNFLMGVPPPEAKSLRHPWEPVPKLRSINFIFFCLKNLNDISVNQ